MSIIGIVASQNYPRTIQVEYLIVGGGGGGGQAVGYNGDNGGAGAGGYLTNTIAFTPSTTYNISVGSGGAIRTNGTNSYISSIISYGGGFGGPEQDTGISGNGGDGGSGGGTGNRWIYAIPTAGQGTIGQGNNGGISSLDSDNGGGGGGGAGLVGSAPPGANSAGNGGVGLQSSITGTATYYAGGGGGGTRGSTRGNGGSGGGGAGAISGTNAVNGTANTGGGGGGAGVTGVASAGGSGVIIIKYLNTYTITISAGLTASTSTAVSGYKITTFTNGTGTISLA
jgi:hypothetical protein